MFKSISKLLAFALAAALALAFPLVSLAASNDTVRVSVASDGTQGDRWSEYPSISADGRFVAFTSQASTLVAGDTNSMNDIFVYDSLSRTTTRVSVASDGAEGYFGAYAASISGDGRYVAFTSSATNLVAGDTNGASDVFLHDTQTGETTRVSLASDGSQGYGWSEVPSISTDGRYIAFYSAATNLVANDTNGASDVFLHDTQTGTTSRISVASGGTQGNDWSYYASISGDGRYVAYKSLASNLVAGDTNGVGDVFMYDTQSAETTRVSVASDGSQADKVSGVSSVSADGRYVAFESDATNLVIGDANGLNDIFLRDIQTGTTSLVSVSSDGTQGNSSAFTPSISGDGRFVLFATDATNLVAGDSNWSHDIFMHDTRSGKTIRVSLASDGSQGNNNSYAPSVSINGRFIAFTSTSSNLVDGDTNGMSDVYLHEVQVDPILRVSLATDGTQGNDWSYAPSISADGRSVAFESDATNLVAGDTNGVSDIFLHDTHNDETTRISLASDGTQGNDWSYAPSISADGRYVAFQSAASNLVADDTNGMSDIFLHDTQSGATTRVSLASDGTQENAGAFDPSISADGRYVVFSSSSTNLVAEDTNGLIDVFLHDTQSGATTRVSLASDGAQGNGWSYDPSISVDGRYVAFFSYSTNLVANDTNGMGDIFLHDTQSGATTLVSLASDGTHGNDGASSPSISADGRYVAFSSSSTNLVAEDTNGVSDIFLHDTQSGATTRISLASDGTQANANSFIPSISANGRHVAFVSAASNLVTGDANGLSDVFLHDILTGRTIRISLASDGTEGDGEETENRPSISPDGRYVAFESNSTNLVAGDTNGVGDAFVYENNVDTTIPAVFSVVRSHPSPTALNTVDFTVTFSEAVEGVDLTGLDYDDFILTTSGGISGVSISAVSGANAAYTVTVNTGSGNGTISLDVVTDGAITDLAGIPLAAGYTEGPAYTVSRTPTFADVPLSYWASNFIERLSFAEITGGCGGGNFCPTKNVTRAQMAVFVLRAAHGPAFTPPTATGTVFTDVPADGFAAAWIEQMAAEGITGGCGDNKFCPNASITRAQMAVFLVKAMYGSAYTPPAASGAIFADVPADGFAAAFIEQLVADGITGGCGGGNFCPNKYITRAEMAVFLVAAFNLP